MTTDGIESMATDELVLEFRDLAQRTGTVFTIQRTPEKIRQTPERQQLTARLKTIAAELRARAPIDEIRRMLQDDDLDIRGWAAPQFMTTIPELAQATFTGLIVRKPASEIMDLQRRAKTRPPRRPLLTDMSIDALVERFEDAATREYATRFVSKGDSPQDIELYNRISGEVTDIMRELKRRDALARLLLLLDSPNITVRKEAAIATLTVDPKRSGAVLEAVVASRDTYELGDASLALSRFRGGTSVVYGVG
jgi:hypothetical protein